MKAMKAFAALIAALPLTVTAACGSSGGSKTVAGIGGKSSAEKAAIGSAPVASDSEIAASPEAKKIRQRGTLKVGAGYDVPLYSLKDPVTGDYTGFDASLAVMLAKYITGKPNVDWVNVTSDTREALIQNGTIDVAVATYQITPERAKLVNFAGPYLIGGGGILVRSDNTTVHGLSDLNGVKTCTMPAVAAEALKKLQPGAKQVIFDSATQCLQALQQGRVDAFFLNSAILSGFAAKNKDVKFAGTPTQDAPFGIGMSKGDPKFKEFVNGWLSKIYADGTWAKLWTATVGTVQQDGPPPTPKIGSVPGS